MQSVSKNNERAALDRFCRGEGYADFDTFVATGGSILGLKTELYHQREQLDLALAALGEVFTAAQAGSRTPSDPAIGPQALARAEAEQAGDAAGQGAEA
jgi:hypothetical protein